MKTVAALYVDPLGPYPKMADVDCWDESRDARRYDGPHPIVAHPPCGSWGRLRKFAHGRDKELAPIAVEQVRTWGGVLEHPWQSKLWTHCDLPRPGTLFRDRFGGWSLEVCQVDWGHVARKRTWLYLIGAELGAAFPAHREPTHWISGSRERRHYKMTGRVAPPGIKICSTQQRRRTPQAFAEWLVELARGVRPMTSPVEAFAPEQEG